MTPRRRAGQRFVVREHRPLRTLVLGVLLGMVLGGTFLLLFGLRAGYVDVSNLGGGDDTRVAERRLLEQRIRELSDENERIASALATAERQRQIESGAQQGIAAHLRQLQGQILALKQEVAFYRGIVAGARGRGFEVQSFTVIPGREKGTYHFRIVLTSDSKDDKVQRGFASFSIDGERDGVPEQLPLRILTGRDDPGYEFRFRFYQKIEGRLALPPGFTPRVINVEISGVDGAVSGVTRSFDWPDKSG